MGSKTSSSYDDTAEFTLPQNNHDKQKIETVRIYYKAGRPGNDTQPKDHCATRLEARSNKIKYGYLKLWNFSFRV